MEGTIFTLAEFVGAAVAAGLARAILGAWLWRKKLLAAWAMPVDGAERNLSAVLRSIEGLVSLPLQSPPAAGSSNVQSAEVLQPVALNATRMSRLMEAFQRLHAGREFEGIGIGLATVKRTVERHGGRVWAQSAPGQGAQFFLTLCDA